MNQFVPGQRWSSDNEAELGLAIIEEVDLRTVKLFFPAVDEYRVYAIDNAPLSRVAFSAGDQVKNRQRQDITITDVRETAGLIEYHGISQDGQQLQFPESELYDSLQLNRPQDRLFNARFDSHKAYVLRYQALSQQYQLAISPVRGLLGPRVSQVPHQFYIAHEVASRPAPRVLLADEVGLGKTIEAGLILHQQIISGRSQRVLIIVPDPLLHQWLVEMLRRFNLRFSLLDEKRCEALETLSDNPFHSEQLVLCSLEFLIAQPQRQEQIVAGHWDLLIVDEAHHLEWREAESSDKYRLVEQLAANTPGLLLLTATPEQLGAESHFARLRLLDPHRFHSLEKFLAEESGYIALAKAAEPLIDGKSLSEEHTSQLNPYLDAQGQQQLQQLVENGNTDPVTRQQLIAQLVDRHGTGRVLFRNTRNTIHGFPARQLHATALPDCTEYQQVFAKLVNDPLTRQIFAEKSRVPLAQLLLAPELIYQVLNELGGNTSSSTPAWTSFDPRLPWLHDTLKSLKGKKVLVICANAHTALELEEHLRTRHGLHAAVFHEGMRIIERDRAAAYFADMENGSQVLICSEIGSEGRNFQFAHHLVLFDLPLNPDLLEQRIGRLDRIGQTQTINIHVPYIANTPSQVMLHWYHDALNAFEKTCPAGQTMYQRFRDALHPILEAGNYDEATVQSLIEAAIPVYQQLNLDMQQGRDRLLEINAFRKDVAEEVISEVNKLEQATDISDFLQRACDLYGVEWQEHSAHSHILKPGDHMLVEHFPELQEDGIVISADRQTALSHEDRIYLTWESPMMTGVMDMLLQGEQGNLALSIIKSKAFPAGTVLLETLYLVHCIAPRKLQADRFLPPTLVRYVMDNKGNNYADKLSFERLQSLPAELDKQTLTQIVNMHRGSLKKILQASQQLASDALPGIASSSQSSMQQHMDAQLQRLRELQQRNPTVRDDEIQQLEDEKQKLAEYLQAPQLKLDALRLIITA